MLSRILAPLSAAWKEATDSQVWSSIFRHGKPVSNRNRALVMMSNVFLHLHPVRLPKHAVKIKYTWCMGGLTFFLFLAETIIAQLGVVITLDLYSHVLPNMQQHAVDAVADLLKRD